MVRKGFADTRDCGRREDNEAVLRLCADHTPDKEVGVCAECRAKCTQGAPPDEAAPQLCAVAESLVIDENPYKAPQIRVRSPLVQLLEDSQPASMRLAMIKRGRPVGHRCVGKSG